MLQKQKCWLHLTYKLFFPERFLHEIKMVPLLKYFVSEWNSGKKIESDRSNGGKFPFKGRLDLHIGMSQKPFGAKPSKRICE